MIDGVHVDDLEPWVAAVLAIPMHRFVGLRLRDPQDLTQGLLLQVTTTSLNQAQLLHGGIVSALLDVAAFVALRPSLLPGEHAVTHAISVQLLRPVGEGAEVHFQGEVLQLGRQVAFLRAEARVEGKIVAVGQVTKSRVAAVPADSVLSSPPEVA